MFKSFKGASFSCSSGCVSELDVSVYELDAAALAADARVLKYEKKIK